MSKKLNLRKTLILMAAINALQTMGILVVTVFGMFSGKRLVPLGQFYLLPLLLLVSLAGTLVAVSLMQPMLLMSLRLKQAEASLNDINHLNMTLRAQRHDFLNHLQVVYSLIELGEFAEARTYIEKVYECVERVSSILKTRIPAVNAILQAKRQMCLNRDIDVSINVRSTLAELPIQAWEFCRILGNIIDNSIHALSDIPNNKRLNIDIYEDLQYFKFKISNNGPMIEPDNIDKIFEAGFTTKGEDGDGMGLAICRRIIDDCDGELKVTSDCNETAFEGSIPRRLRPVSEALADENDSWSI